MRLNCSCERLGSSICLAWTWHCPLADDSGMVWADYSRGLTDAEGGELRYVSTREASRRATSPIADVLTHTLWTAGWLYTTPIHKPGLARRACHEGNLLVTCGRDRRTSGKAPRRLPAEAWRISEPRPPRCASDTTPSTPMTTSPPAPLSPSADLSSPSPLPT
jgi:hypothetical protein